MPRLIIALLIALYAIAFGFAAMAAIRWPSLMLIAAFAFDTMPDARLNDVNWRELGIVFAGPYLLSAICLYASSIAVSRVRKGGILWFLMGCIAGFPCVFMVDFEPGWWQNPSPGEGAVLGAAVAAILLFFAILNLRPSRKTAADAPPLVLDAREPQPPAALVAPPAKKQNVRRGPVPPAIARQRQAFAEEGRRMREKRSRSRR